MTGQPAPIRRAEVSVGEDYPHLFVDDTAYDEPGGRAYDVPVRLLDARTAALAALRDANDAILDHLAETGQLSRKMAGDVEILNMRGLDPA